MCDSTVEGAGWRDRQATFFTGYSLKILYNDDIAVCAACVLRSLLQPQQQAGGPGSTSVDIHSSQTLANQLYVLAQLEARPNDQHKMFSAASPRWSSSTLKVCSTLQHVTSRTLVSK
jgi:hypothetical protein